MVKFRTRNHRLPIEVGNWRRIPLNDRKCTNCNMLGDEFHYLFECKLFDNLRLKSVKNYYIRNPSTFKLDSLMNTKNNAEYIKLCLFVKQIMINNR